MNTIRQKWLLLISVPLILEVLFCILMLFLEQQYERSLTNERMIRQRLESANQMWMDCTLAVVGEAYYKIFGGQPPEINLIESKAKHFAKLQPLAENAPEMKADLVVVDGAFNGLAQLFSQLQPVAAATDPSSKIAALQHDLQILSSMQDWVDNIGNALQRLETPARESGITAAERTEQTKNDIASALQSMLVLSAGLAVFLFLYFVREISTGVEILLANTERFKNSEPLLAPIEGKDELADLDRAFHEMSSEIHRTQQMKASLLAAISHDVRTPLGSVLGFLEVLVMRIAPAHQLAREGGVDAVHDINYLIRLITNLLDLQKAQVGKLDIAPRIEDLHPIVCKAMDSVHDFLEPKHRRILWNQSDARVFVDQDRFRQALENVLLQAAYLSADQRPVEVSLEDHPGQAIVRISYAGPVLSPEHCTALFDQYRQQELRELAPDAPALSIPLARAIMRLHGGDVTIESSRTGASFLMTIPERGCT